MSRYHVLVVKYKPQSADDCPQWVVEFGDYSKSVVMDEKRDLMDGDDMVQACRVITVPVDAQAAIDAAIEALNTGKISERT